MTPNTKRTIWFSIIGLALIAGGIGYYLYNKKPIDVESASADVKTSAVELYQAFSTDSVSAKKKFSETNEVVEVNGTVVRTSTNQDKQTIVLLKTNEGGAYVNCTMEGKADGIKDGDVIKLKGLCTGLQAVDADFGIKGDLMMGRCYIIK